MAIKFDNDNMVVHEDLNRDEAIIFGKFLLAEWNRHDNDINKIKNTIHYLEDKHNIRIMKPNERIAMMIKEIKSRKSNRITERQHNRIVVYDWEFSTSRLCDDCEDRPEDYWQMARIEVAIVDNLKYQMKWVCMRCLGARVVNI